MIIRKKNEMLEKDRQRLRKLRGKQVSLEGFHKKTEENSVVEQVKVPQEMKVVHHDEQDNLDINGQPKLKSKAEIRKSIKIKTHIQVLNGQDCIRYSNVPTILLDMKPPKDYHEMAQNQNFAMWFKLEGKEYMNITKQLKSHLRELTIWLDKEDEIRLRNFMEKGDV